MFLIILVWLESLEILWYMFSVCALEMENDIEPIYSEPADAMKALKTIGFTTNAQQIVYTLPENHRLDEISVIVDGFVGVGLQVGDQQLVSFLK